MLSNFKKAITNYLTMSEEEIRLGLIVCCIAGCVWFYRAYQHGELYWQSKKAQPYKLPDDVKLDFQ